MCCRYPFSGTRGMSQPSKGQVVTGWYLQTQKTQWTETKLASKVFNLFILRPFFEFIISLMLMLLIREFTFILLHESNLVPVFYTTCVEGVYIGWCLRQEHIYWITTFCLQVLWRRQLQLAILRWTFSWEKHLICTQTYAPVCLLRATRPPIRMWTWLPYERIPRGNTAGSNMWWETPASLAVSCTFTWSLNLKLLLPVKDSMHVVMLYIINRCVWKGSLIRQSSTCMW